MSDDGHSVLGPGGGAAKGRIFSIERNGPDRSLDGIGVDLDAAVVDEPGKPISVRPDIISCRSS